jgi:hypothetical protein
MHVKASSAEALPVSERQIYNGYSRISSSCGYSSKFFPWTDVKTLLIAVIIPSAESEDS